MSNWRLNVDLSLKSKLFCLLCCKPRDRNKHKIWFLTHTTSTFDLTCNYSLFMFMCVDRVTALFQVWSHHLHEGFMVLALPWNVVALDVIRLWTQSVGFSSCSKQRMRHTGHPGDQVAPLPASSVTLSFRGHSLLCQSVKSTNLLDIVRPVTPDHLCQLDFTGPNIQKALWVWSDYLGGSHCHIAIFIILKLYCQT